MTAAKGVRAVARILVVEEDEGVFTALAVALGCAGHAVERARAPVRPSGDPWNGSFDVFLVGVPMPDWCGPHFLRELRRACPRVPVIALTGGGKLSSVGYLPDVARSGAACILRKPFAAGEVLDAVRWAIEPPEDSGGGSVGHESRGWRR